MLRDNSLLPKNIVITGGNSGIGYQTMKSLYLQGHHIIFGSRDELKNQQTASKIKNQQGGTIKHFRLDLSSKNGIESFAKNIQKHFKSVDILINNAGQLMGESQKNSQESGYEMTLVVNHFGHFYLTYLLFELIKLSSQARIINVSSIAQYFAPNRFLQDLECKDKKYSNTDQYSISKLFNVIFTIGLNNLLNKNKFTTIKTMSLHPGNVDTNIGAIFREQNCLYRFIRNYCSCCLRDPESGARTSLHLCRIPFQQLQSGEYYDSDTKIGTMNKKARDINIVNQLWEISQKVYKISFV